MRAVPKINTEGLYIEDVIVDDAFTGVVPFYADPHVSELLPEIDTGAADEQPEEELQPAGYIVVGVTVPAGFYHPRFDLAAWEEYYNAIVVAEEAYQAAYSEWIALPEDERGEPPIYEVPEQPVLWYEGLTPEEIEALHPPQEPSEMELLLAEVVGLKHQNSQQQETIDTVGIELGSLKTSNEDQQQTISTIGAEQIKQDLSTLDLKQQNAVLGAELVKKDIAILDLQLQNQSLGQMLTALELKILAGGGIGNVQQ